MNSNTIIPSCISNRAIGAIASLLFMLITALPIRGAEVLLSDDFSSGVRNVQNLPDNGAWYYTSSTRLAVSGGNLVATVDSSRLGIVYFTERDPRELADGEELVVSWTFSVAGINSTSTSRGLRIGLYRFGDAPRLESDDFSSGDNGSRGVTGYLLNMNFSTQFRVDNPLEIRRRNGDLAAFANNGNLMGSVPGSGLYGPSLGSGGSNGTPAFQAGVVYVLEYRVKRMGEVAEITVRISDSAGWEVVAEAVDSDSPVLGFDAFAFRPDGEANTGNPFTIYSMDVRVLGGDPVDPVDPIDPMDPEAFARFLAAAEDMGDGWYETAALGPVYVPDPAHAFVYASQLQTWYWIGGLKDSVYLLHEVSGDIWLATDDGWQGALWSYDWEKWYRYADGQISEILPETVEPTDPPEIAAGSPMGYATVPGMGINALTGGKGGPVVHVNTLAQIKAEVAGNAPKIVVISGTFEGGDSIKVGSNKTILGAHPGATFRGIGFELDNVSNVILRNLRISHVLAAVANDGDCIRIVNGAHHIWVDHCELFNDNPRVQTNKDLYDGLLDITNGSDFVTVSWTHFHNHHKFVLIGSTDTASRYNDPDHLRVTLHHNLLENPYKKDSRTGSRLPSLRFGKAHVFNNVYRNLGEGIRARHATAKVLVENNVFDYLGYTWFSDNGGCFTIGDNLMINEANKNAREVPICDPDFTVPYAYIMDSLLDVEANVMAGVGVGRIDPFENLP